MNRKEVLLARLKELYALMLDLSQKNVFVYGRLKRDLERLAIKIRAARGDWADAVPGWAFKGVKWEHPTPSTQVNSFIQAVTAALDAAEEQKIEQKEMF